MIFPEEQLHKKIAMSLSVLSIAISTENDFSCFDSNRYAQDFFGGLLEHLGFRNVEDLDKKYKKPNYPAIDLSGLDDKGNKVAFQITTDSSKNKFQGTIDRYMKLGFHKEYTQLIFIIIQENELRSPHLVIKPGFTFIKDRDIWYIQDIVKAIQKLDFEKIQALETFLVRKLPDLTRLICNINFQDLENALDFITDVLFPEEEITLNKNQEIPKRGNDFIDQKNELNAIKEVEYKTHIEKDIRYNYTIIDFIQKALSQNGIVRYYASCRKINQEISEGHDILDILCNMHRKMDYSCKAKKDVTMILLHNMYYMCDIGNNPQ